MISQQLDRGPSDLTVAQKPGINRGREENSMTDALTAFGSVFLMTRLRDGAHHEQISSTLASVLAEHSLELTRADWQLEREELWANVRHCMERAQYGVAFFDRVLKVRPKFP